MRVAVLDDTPEDVERLDLFLHRYAQERDLTLNVETFDSGEGFLAEFRSQYDVVFLDIEMPGVDGMGVARAIREKDGDVGIVFVTNLAQYAVQGYEVSAVDFIVKPYTYYVLCEKLDRALARLKRRERHTLLLSGRDGVHRIPTSSLLYIEKKGDYLVFHTEEGVFRERGSIRACRERLAGLPFGECTSGCLVNLDYVTRIGKEDISLGEVTLPLSRRLRRQFTDAYVDYVSEV